MPTSHSNARPERKRAGWLSALFLFFLISSGYVADQFSRRDVDVPRWFGLIWLAIAGVWLVVLVILWIFAAKESLDAPNRSELGSAKPRGDRCSGCGYSLAGLPDVEKCPECGKPLSFAELMERAKVSNARPPMR
ncbi:MAG TPA: hypothetical protein VHC70_01585 [Phycisphaerales bacterium]|jgi:hypothetical protein|nr:hypothetical protein [Phycisphaerales bacterium]